MYRNSQFCSSSTIGHICVLPGKSTMLNHCATFHGDLFQRHWWFIAYRLQCSLCYHHCGYKATTISQLLHQENLKASHIGITKYNEAHSIERKLGSGRPSKILAEMWKAAFRETLRSVTVRLSFSISRCGNMQNFLCTCTQISTTDCTWVEKLCNCEWICVELYGIELFQGHHRYKLTVHFALFCKVP